MGKPGDKTLDRAGLTWRGWQTLNKCPGKILQTTIDKFCSLFYWLVMHVIIFMYRLTLIITYFIYDYVAIFTKRVHYCFFTSFIPKKVSISLFVYWFSSYITRSFCCIRIYARKRPPRRVRTRNIHHFVSFSKLAMLLSSSGLLRSWYTSRLKGYRTWYLFYTTIFLQSQTSSKKQPQLLFLRLARFPPSASPPALRPRCRWSCSRRPSACC